MGQDSHMRRLLIEQERLINLASRSDFIEIEPIDLMPGVPPDKYVITFTCNGIARISGNKEPIASNFHQVSMYISRDFPRQEPHLRWMTPIWHPNIEHQEPYHVCTNDVQNYYSTKGLDDLVLVLGEMVQYKRYHAAWSVPWPLDREAADWVVNYAEPRGIVAPDKPFDPQPLVREYKIRLGGGRARPLNSAPSSANDKSNSLPPVGTLRKKRITFRTKRNL